MFQMMGVFAEFERAMLRERVLAGIARARLKAERSGENVLKRPTLRKITAIQTPRAKGLGVRRIATDLHVGVGMVLRVLDERKGPASLAG